MLVMSHHIVRAVLSLVLLVMAAGCITEKDEPVVSVGVGDAVPQFSVTLDDGTLFDYDAIRRHRCVIVFFDTSCPDCRAALPVIQSVATALAGSSSGVAAAELRASGAVYPSSELSEHADLFSDTSDGADLFREASEHADLLSDTSDGADLFREASEHADLFSDTPDGADSFREASEHADSSSDISDEAMDVRFICISRGEAQPSVAAYWQEAGLTLPYSAQPDDAVYRLFANRIIPRVYVTRPGFPLPVISAIFVERLTPEALAAALR